MIKRNTIQLSLVLEGVNKLHCHATADEIYASLTTDNLNISRGTVYRNLNRLAATGAIRKIKIPGGADCFDNRIDDHYHIRCDKCGKVFDVDMDYVSGLEQRINDIHGFQFTGCDIVFRGICPNCRKK